MPPIVDPVPMVFAVLLGLVFGSFLNVCIVRLPAGGSIVSPRSKCPHCGRAIRTSDNIPVLSWLLLRGRCRDCGEKISVRYPVVEGATALLFAACLWRFGLELQAVGMATFCWLLLGLLWMDAETFLLPNAFTIPGMALGVTYSTFMARTFIIGMLNALLGAAAIAGFLLLVGVVYRLVRRRQGMGLGDVKLGAVLGAWLGWQMGVVALFLAIIGGGLGGILLATRHRRRTVTGESLRTLRIPFGTFLAAAGIVTVFAGSPLLNWYLGFYPQ